MTAGGNAGGTHLGGKPSGTTIEGLKVLTLNQRRSRQREQKWKRVKTNTADALPKGLRESGNERKVTKLTPSPQILATSKCLWRMCLEVLH